MTTRLIQSRFGPLKVVAKLADDRDGACRAALLREHPRLTAVRGAVGADDDAAVAALVHFEHDDRLDWLPPLIRGDHATGFVAHVPAFNIAMHTLGPFSALPAADLTARATRAQAQ